MLSSRSGLGRQRRLFFCGLPCNSTVTTRNGVPMPACARPYGRMPSHGRGSRAPSLCWAPRARTAAGSTISTRPSAWCGLARLLHSIPSSIALFLFSASHFLSFLVSHPSHLTISLTHPPARSRSSSHHAFTPHACLINPGFFCSIFLVFLRHVLPGNSAQGFV